MLYIVPARDDGLWLRTAMIDNNGASNGGHGRPVAVIVLADGTELHFFQFYDSDESINIDDTR